MATEIKNCSCEVINSINVGYEPSPECFGCKEEAPYEMKPEISKCCKAPIFYLICDDDTCPDFHEFAICEICGKDEWAGEYPCERPDGWEKSKRPENVSHETSAKG